MTGPQSKEESTMQKITPFLWFDDNADEGANFYVSIFKNSRIGNISRYGEEGAKVSGRAKGTVMTVTFQLDGQEFMALNGGPHFKFSEAISFLVNCETQQERSEEHTSELQSPMYLVCRLLLEKKKKHNNTDTN